MQSAGDWIRHGVKFGAGLHAAEAALRRPCGDARPAPAGLGDGLNVTALRGSPTARPLRSQGKQRPPQPLFMGPLYPWPPSSRSLGVRNLIFQVSGSCTALSRAPSSPFLCFCCSSSPFPLPLAVWLIQQGSTPSGFVREPNSPCVVLSCRDSEVLMSNLEDFETSS